MSALDLTQPIDPKSKAWCGDCDFKAYGIWAHRTADAHFQKHLPESMGEHIVYVKTPDTPEEVAEREAKIAQLEAEEAEALEKRDGTMIDLTGALGEVVERARTARR